MVCSKSDPIEVPVIAGLVIGERELVAVIVTWSRTLDLFRKFAIRPDVILPTVRRSKRSRMGWSRNRVRRRVAVLRSESESAELANKLEFVWKGVDGRDVPGAGSP